jgi:hypothetical protein
MASAVTVQTLFGSQYSIMRKLSIVFVSTLVA